MTSDNERSRAARLVLTERDVRLLASVAESRYLTVTQLQRLHFPSEQTTTRRLRALMRAGHLSSFRVPGMPDRFMGITEAGAKVVKDGLGHEVRVPPRRKPSDAYFLRHFGALNDIKIAVELACETSDVRLIRFIPEYEGELGRDGLPRKQLQDTTNVEGVAVSHTPDGVFALERGGRAALFFVEVDRGTETLSDGERGVLKMLRFYLAYLVDEGYQRYATLLSVPRFKAFRVLVTTTSEARLQNMRSLGGEIPFEPAHAKRFIWLATQESVTEQTILGPVWRALEPTDGIVYSIAPDQDSTGEVRS